MSHLHETNLNYIEHMLRALQFSFKLFRASLGLFIHAFIPETLTHYGTDQVLSIYKNFVIGDKILIRFNTKWEEDSLKRNWRVLINGEEFLASDIIVYVPSSTTVEDIAQGVTKWHILCRGHVHWNGNIANIKPY